MMYCTKTLCHGNGFSSELDFVFPSAILSIKAKLDPLKFDLRQSVILSKVSPVYLVVSKRGLQLDPKSSTIIYVRKFKIQTNVL